LPLAQQIYKSDVALCRYIYRSCSVTFRHQSTFFKPKQTRVTHIF